MVTLRRDFLCCAQPPAAMSRASLLKDRELLEQFDAGQSVAQLPQAHDRTRAGIHARLVRHGRLRGTGPQWRLASPVRQPAQFVASQSNGVLVIFRDACTMR